LYVTEHNLQAGYIREAARHSALEATNFLRWLYCSKSVTNQTGNYDRETKEKVSTAKDLETGILLPD
jgi:hypothetical protein